MNEAIVARDYVIVDFETTGLDHNIEQATEVSAIRTDADLNVIGSYQAYVKLEDGRTISDFVHKLTGLTAEFLEANGISEGHAIKGLWDFIGESEVAPIVVAHHAPFDFSFLGNYGLAPEHFICTRVLSRLVEPYEKASLADVAKRHGFYDAEGHHKASKDIEMTRKVLQKLMPIADQLGINYRNVVVDSSERPLTFVPAYASVIQY